MTDRPIVFAAWTHVGARQRDLALEFGGKAVVISGTAERGTRGAFRRYVTSALQMWRGLKLLRPSLVVVSVPPLPAGLVAYVFARRSGVAFALDSHPGAFGLMGDSTSRRLQLVHVFLIRRAAFVAVTTHQLADRVAALGGKPAILHEPPITRPVRARVSPTLESARVVLFPGSGGRDEPLELLFQTAEHLPDWRFLVTGNFAHVLQQERSLPSNLEAVGFLPEEQYLELLAAATVVAALSTEPESVMRTAYEAAYLGIPLVVLDNVATREAFALAERVEMTAQSLADGIERAGSWDNGSRAALAAATRSQWQRQANHLRALLAAARPQRPGGRPSATNN